MSPLVACYVHRDLCTLYQKSTHHLY